jgi:hypothetical protein
MVDIRIPVVGRLGFCALIVGSTSLQRSALSTYAPRNVNGFIAKALMRFGCLFDRPGMIDEKR